MLLPRFYPILDAEVLATRGVSLETAARAVMDGGAGIVQWRSKEAVTRASFAEVEWLAALCRDRGVLFVVNDRADVARLVEAGLHVGQEDLPAAAARRLVGPEALLGLSTHNEAQLAAAAGAPVDYVALGPIFATRSKMNPDPEVGLQQLYEWRKLTSRPLVAIGGITRDNADAVFDSGADSVAVIGDLLPEECTGATIRARVEEWVSVAGPAVL